MLGCYCSFALPSYGHPNTNIRKQNPTGFTLETFEPSYVDKSLELKSDLESYITTTTATKHCPADSISGNTQRSLLYLRIQAAAEFYTTNQTLMNDPPPVLVDISKLAPSVLAKLANINSS